MNNIFSHISTSSLQTLSSFGTWAYCIHTSGFGFTSSSTYCGEKILLKGS